MPTVFVAPVSFGAHSPESRRRLDATGWEIHYNRGSERMSANALATQAYDCEAVIAGTEPLHQLVAQSTKLKLVARTGVGLDSVPLALCRERGIVVTYVASAATTAVAELTLAQMITLIRQTALAHDDMRGGKWQRRFGVTLAECRIGIVGFGRVGSTLANLLLPFHPSAVMAVDIVDKTAELAALQAAGLAISAVDLATVCAEADLISLHVPLWKQTQNLFSAEVLGRLKEGAYLLNYSRGGLVDETALAALLRSGHLGGAAIDTFSQEPYGGPLVTAPRVLITPHMGACTMACRAEMERSAVDAVIRFFRGNPLTTIVPFCEYHYQASG